MHIEIPKIVGSLIGAFLFTKILFWLFTPSETITAIFIFLITFAAYGIQLTEWSEGSRISLLGINVYSGEKVYQQYRIFGIIPISPKKLVKNDKYILDDLTEEQKKALINAFEPVFSKFVYSMFPFGTLKKAS